MANFMCVILDEYVNMTFIFTYSSKITRCSY